MVKYLSFHNSSFAFRYFLKQMARPQSDMRFLCFNWIFGFLCMYCILVDFMFQFHVFIDVEFQDHVSSPHFMFLLRPILCDLGL
jgi:hypothetical protein